LKLYHIGGVIVNVLASSGFEPRSDQTKVYKIGICCFYAKNTALRRKIEQRLVGSASEWGEMSIHGLLFQ